MRAAELKLDGHDLVCLAVPARRCPPCSPPTASGSRGAPACWSCPRGSCRRSARCPSAFAAERCAARAVAVLGGPARRRRDARARRLGGARLDRRGVRPAARRRARAPPARRDHDQRCHRRRARRLREERGRAGGGGRVGRRARTSPAPRPARCSPRSTRSRGARGGRPETFAGLAGAGDLVATVVASELARTAAPASCSPRASRRRRSGRARPRRRGGRLGAAARRASRGTSQLETPALDSLAALVEGRIEPEQWTATVTDPARRARRTPYPRRVSEG